MLELSEEVASALHDGSKGIVALESTIITHGMPYPETFETAKAVEQVVRDNGSIPATIAIINGIVKIV
jgi:pseudouridine-5'-phosphate glycosidase